MSNYAFILNNPESVVEVIYEGVNADLLRTMNVRLTNLENAFALHVGDSGNAQADLEDQLNSLDTLVQAQASALVTETGLRELADTTISTAFAEDLLEVSNTLGDAIEAEAEARAQAVLDEATARGAAVAELEFTVTTDVAALAGQVTALATDLASAEASIIEVSEALSTETAARAVQYSAIQADFDDNSAAILEESVARADADTAIASTVSVLSASVATKITTFRQTSAPTATAVGDLWYDSDDGNKMYRWSGSTWVLADNAQIATNAAAIVTEASARASGDSANASSITALTAVVSAKNVTYRQTTAPASGMVAGDLWFDSDDDNKPYRYNGSSWVATDDTRIATVSAAVITEASARVSADGTIEAKYGVKVDVNGHVSGFGLIATANGAAPTSAFVVTASSFQVFDGTSSLPVFSISGGVVRMQNVVIGNAVIENLAVGTSKIANSAVTKVVPGSGGSSTPTTLTSATWTTVASASLGGTDWNDQSGTPGGQYKRIITVSVDMTAVDSGTFANAFVSCKIRTGDGSGSWNDLWEGMSDGGVTTIKNYGQIKGSFTIVHDVDDGFVGLPNTRIYQLQLYATGATSRQYKYCSITVQSVKK